MKSILRLLFPNWVRGLIYTAASYAIKPHLASIGKHIQQNFEETDSRLKSVENFLVYWEVRLDRIYSNVLQKTEWAKFGNLEGFGLIQSPSNCPVCDTTTGLHLVILEAQYGKCPNCGLLFAFSHVADNPRGARTSINLKVILRLRILGQKRSV